MTEHITVYGQSSNYYSTLLHLSCSPGGYLTLAGRKKELINRGGEKIAPAEVEAAVDGLPGVASAVTFALPDEWCVVGRGTLTVLSASCFPRVPALGELLWRRSSLN